MTSSWSATDLGHFALTNLLLPKLTDRVVTVSSALHRMAAHPGYSNTNLQGQTGNRLGDLVMRTFGNGLFATSPDFGARQTLYAASQDLSGNTFIGPRFGIVGRSGPVGRSLLAKRGSTAAGLWELSAQLTGVQFPL